MHLADDVPRVDAIVSDSRIMPLKPRSCDSLAEHFIARKECRAVLVEP